MPSKRKKKEQLTYYQRWLKKHPRIWLYITKEEHEYLKKIANKEGKSFKELLLEALKFMKEEYPKLKHIKEENDKLKKEKEQLEKTITQLQQTLSTMKEEYRKLKKEKEELEKLVSQLQITKTYMGTTATQIKPKR